jgi:ribonuclease III
MSARTLTAKREQELRALGARLGHEFKQLALLDQALTHASRAFEERARGTGDNESLEFLGDSILGFLIAELLHRAEPDGSEGAKSRRKAQLVSSASLARRAEALGLPRLLRLGRGEERAGGRASHALWADAFEAVIAALYLDGGFRTVRRLVASVFTDVSDVALDILPDFKGTLQERLQAQGRALPEYRVVAVDGPTERRRFRVACFIGDSNFGEGSGHSKKEAGREAARLALARLQAEE